MTAAVSSPSVEDVSTVHVVLRPAPRREPPFDDELTEPSRAGRYDQFLPFDPPPRPLPSPFTTRRPDGVVDPGPWARLLLVGLSEVAAGRRALHQLRALMSPGIVRGLGGEFDRAAATGRPHWLRAAGVRTVRATEPADGVAELSATLEVGTRVRAVALRLEVRHGRWCCTRLQMG